LTQQQNPSPSFLSDIKALEKHMVQHPDSYLFARLAEASLKHNLLDDALRIARQGVKKYPFFAAGQRAMAMVCDAKGLTEERLKALEAFVAVLPEDIDAQKELAKLYVACGNQKAALVAYQTALEFHSDDMECVEALRSLRQALEVEMIIELTEDDIWIEKEAEQPIAKSLSSEADPDPLSTATLAELYVKQGFVPKALEIYRSLRDADPSNSQITSRIAELESMEALPEPQEAVNENIVAEPVLSAKEAPVLPSRGQADEAVLTLEGWLDNIRRIKACR